MTPGAAESASLLERLKRRKIVQWELAYLAGSWVVELAALRDDVPLATERLDGFADDGYRDVWTLRRDPVLATARSDARFAAVLAEIEEVVEAARTAVRRMPDETEWLRGRR